MRVDAAVDVRDRVEAFAELSGNPIWPFARVPMPEQPEAGNACGEAVVVKVMVVQSRAVTSLFEPCEVRFCTTKVYV